MDTLQWASVKEEGNHEKHEKYERDNNRTTNGHEYHLFMKQCH